MTCAKCTLPGNEGLRVAWGCDVETATPLLSVECVMCDGKNSECDWCHGTNEIPVTRCPHATVQPEHTMAVQALSFAQVGLMPTAAGWAEHPATLMQAINLVAKAKERFEKEGNGGT